MPWRWQNSNEKSASIPAAARNVGVDELCFKQYSSFTVRAGIPVVWTLHAEEEKLIGCNNELLIPALDLDVSLHPGDNVISFTPEEAGTIPYSCWLGMIRAVITVVQ